MVIEISTELTEVVITSLPQEAIDQAAVVMASAFTTDPLGIYLLPEARGRLDVMQWFWREALSRTHPHGHIYTTAPKLWGVASWLPPDVPHETLWSLWRSMIQLLYQAGWRSTHRLLALIEFTDRLRDHCCPSLHWYLDGLAVAPESQGKGVGSFLLQPVLDRADYQGQACCLYTSTERAVRFYQRQGFVVGEEARFQPEAPPLWLMVRSPK